MGYYEKGISQMYCALYDSPKGSYEEKWEEFDKDMVIFYSSRPVETKDVLNMDSVTQIVEELFGSSAAQKMAAFVSLAAVATFTY